MRGAAPRLEAEGQAPDAPPGGPAWPVVLLSYVLTWACWLPAARLGRAGKKTPASLLTALGGFGPSLAGLAVVAHDFSPAQRRVWWARVVDQRPIAPRAYMAMLTFPACVGAAALVQRRGGSLPEFPALARLRAQPAGLLPLLAVGIVGGPLSEELGWRGVALDRLLARRSAVSAGLTLGIAWALWHLPLFFIPGTIQHKRGAGTPHFWLFFPAIVAQSAVITYIYVESRRSILAAILAHLASNLTSTVFTPLPLEMEAHRAALLSLAALLLAGAGGRRHDEHGIRWIT